MRNRLVATVLSAALLAALGCLGGGPARAQDEAPKPPDVTPAPPGVTVNGAVEVYYTYNFNRPENGNNTFLYNFRDAQLGLQNVDVRIGKAATPASRTGFLVRLVGGDLEQVSIAPDDYDNVLEAYGTLLIPLGGRDVKVDAGQFVTHVGYETLELGTNPNFSKSFLFQYPPPFYNAGVRAAFPLSARTTVTGFLLNRYNGTNDSGNRDIAPGFQIAHAISPTTSIILNGLTSRENLGPILGDNGTPEDTSDDIVLGQSNRQQSILDLVVTSQVSPSARLALEALYRWGDNFDGDSYSVYGIAGYGSLTLRSGNILSLRGEYLKANDTNNPVINYPDDPGARARLTEITLTYELRSGLFPGVRTLFELRHDQAGEPFFGNKDGGFKKDQTTLTLGQSYSF